MQFVDREYEKRVREQYHAIKKAIPYWVAHELQRPITSQSEADRVASKHRTFLEEAAKERNINRFSYEAFMRVCVWCGRASALGRHAEEGIAEDD